MEEFDIFISHATEDKESLVRPLAAKLIGAGYRVWLDELSLKLGDSLRRSLDGGLRKSRYGVVVLSQGFFRKNWPQYELDALIQREVSGGEKVVLPVWHGVDHALVSSYSLTLADRIAVNSSEGLDAVFRRIVEVLGPPAERPVATEFQDVPGAERKPIEAVKRIERPFEMEMIKVSKGPVAPGSGLRSAKAGSVVSEFFISKAPITNSQFDVYLEATGATRFIFWSRRLTGGRRLGSEPAEVSWHEAVTCSRWIRQVTALAVRLPTEAEWVNAASGQGQLDFALNLSEWCADGFSEGGAVSPRDPVVKEPRETRRIIPRHGYETLYYRVGRTVASRSAAETRSKGGFRLVLSQLFLDWL